MLGISIYPEKEKQADILNYISLAAKYGFKRIFSCLLSVNDTKENIKNEFKIILNHATKLGMEVILDIAPRVFGELQISYSDLSYFAELGATGIRLDEGFDGLKEAQMTFNKYNLDIEINMSSGTKYVDNILSFSPNRSKLIACHNFYPMEYSGLSLEFFTQCSQQYKALGIRSAAFVNSPSADHGPWPIMDGLCTLEMHRNLPITTQVKHHLLMGLVDDIIIANAFASEEELKAVGALTKAPVFDIKFNSKVTAVEKQIVLNEPHFNRGDQSAYMIRSTQSRIKYKQDEFKPHDTAPELQLGDVCICNENFGQYKGELHLVKQTHNNTSSRKNVVATVVEHEKFLLSYLKPWSVFAFKEAK